MQTIPQSTSGNPALGTCPPTPAPIAMTRSPVLHGAILTQQPGAVHRTMFPGDES